MTEGILKVGDLVTPSPRMQRHGVWSDIEIPDILFGTILRVDKHGKYRIRWDGLPRTAALANCRYHHTEIELP